jgi:hypothetical protein
MHVCQSLAWQALGAQACRVNIVQAWRARPSGTEIVGVCISCAAGLWGGPAKQRSCRAVQALGTWLAKQRLCKARGHGPAKRSFCRGVPALGSRPSRMEVCVCISSVPGLGSVAWQSGACAGLFRPGGACGLADILNVCGSLALRAHPTEILRF